MAFKVKEYPSLKLFIHSYKLVKEGCEHVTGQTVDHPGLLDPDIDKSNPISVLHL